MDSYGDLLVPIILNKLPQKTTKNKVRDHDSKQWNLRDLQEVIRKEVRVFESELVTGHLPQSIHPFPISATNQSNAANQCLCTFCKGCHSSTHCVVITDKQTCKEFVTQRNLALIT